MLKLVFLSLLAIACSSPQQLTKKAMEIEVYTKKPTGCQVVGKVVGVHKAGSMDLARNHAQNLAAKLDATGMFVDQEVPNGKEMMVYATAYVCK